MSYLDITSYIPGVKGPEKRLTFKDKIKWTAIMLLFFLVMSQIFVWGIDKAALQNFVFLETVLGSSMGTLMTLGIGPIVTASIILQLLNGSGLIKFDTKTAEGKAKFQGTQKLLAVILALVESVAFVAFGAVPPASGAPLVILAVIMQLAFGGMIVILMDEVISKWGIGSGISLFIAAGVSRQIFISAFNFITAGGGRMGLLPSSVQSFISGDPLAGFVALIPIIFTLIVFGIVVYAQAMKVNIPLTIGNMPFMRGAGHRYPLKLIYTSNIPVILVAALLANLQLWARMLQSRGITWFGTVADTGHVTGGLLSWISPQQADMSSIVIAITTGTAIPDFTFKWITYALFLIAGSIMFSVFWMKTAGMDPKSVANNLHGMGMGVAGFRGDVRVIERILNRYIPTLAIIGGAFVGLLAAFADFTGVLGTGTGILLAVMIVFNLYESIARQHMEDMNPAFRKFMGG